MTGAARCGATRFLRAAQRQHSDARPSFVNRQERTSLDVLSVRFECLDDDAHGSIREQVLSSELDDARPVTAPAARSPPG